MMVHARPSDAALGGELMSAPVLTAAVTDSLWDAWQMLVISGLRHLVVVDSSGGCLGVLSDRTVLSDIPTTIEHLGTMTIGSALERVPQLSISPERSVHEAAAIMSAHMVDAVPVITDEERLVGIITSADIVNWAAK